MEEEWRPVVGFEGRYSVSNQGRVRSEARTVTRSDGKTQFVRERIMKQNPSGPDRNYLFVVLHISGVPYSRKVHRLVLEAFVGPCPEGMEGCHGPNGTLDNRLVSLRWDTRSSNIRDQVESGTHYSHGRTKTHCPLNHPYNEDNTRYSITKSGAKLRYCRECKRLKAAERRRRA